MADEAAQAQEQALKVLRGEAQAGVPAAAPASAAAGLPPAPPSIEESRRQEAEVAQQRSEREARLKAEAAQRMAERELRQAEKRVQFEAFIKERERLRREQRAADEVIVREAGQAMPVAGAAGTTGSAGVTVIEEQQEAQARALEVLRSATPESAPAPVATAPAEAAAAPAESAPARPPVTEAEVAPVVTAQPAADNSAEAHARALEILRQSQAGAEPAAAVAPGGTPKVEQKSAEPTMEERQKRIREIEERVKARSSGTGGQPAAVPETKAPETKPPERTAVEPEQQAAPASDDYARDLQQRAAELVRQAQPTPQPAADAPAAMPAPAAVAAPAAAAVPAPAAPSAATPPPVVVAPAASAEPAQPALDRRTREIIQRQDREISRQTATPRRVPQNRNLNPEAEARAREVLRQQQDSLGEASRETPAAAPAAAPAAVAPSTPAVAAETPAPAAVAPAQDPAYSRELEERARQIILERARAEQAAAAQPAAPAAQAAPQSPAPAPAAIPAAQEPAQPSAAAAVETPSAAPAAPAAAPAAKSKRDKLRELTELYRADKLTPAEYHQRRAEILAEP